MFALAVDEWLGHGHAIATGNAAHTVSDLSDCPLIGVRAVWLACLSGAYAGGDAAVYLYGLMGRLAVCYRQNALFSTGGLSGVSLFNSGRAAGDCQHGHVATTMAAAALQLSRTVRAGCGDSNTDLLESTMKKHILTLSALLILAASRQVLANTVDPLAYGTSMQFHAKINTVAAAADYILEPIGYKVVVPAASKAATLDILQRPLSPLAKDAGMVTIQQGLLLLIGPDSRLVIDREHKRVTFEPRPRAPHASH